MDGTVRERVVPRLLPRHAGLGHQLGSATAHQNLSLAVPKLRVGPWKNASHQGGERTSLAGPGAPAAGQMPPDSRPLKAVAGIKGGQATR